MRLGDAGALTKRPSLTPLRARENPETAQTGTVKTDTKNAQMRNVDAARGSSTVTLRWRRVRPKEWICRKACWRALGSHPAPDRSRQQGAEPRPADRPAETCRNL